jgi:hypothetical protein
MATRLSQRSFGWSLTASALALTGVLGLVACQSSGGADVDDDTSRAAERDEEEASEPESATRVPARSADADDDSNDVGDAEDAPEAPAQQEPASEQSSTEPSEANPETPASGDVQTPVAAAQTFAACYTDGGPYSECETMYVTVTQAEPARCIQLTIDTCGTYGRQGLSADTPASWRLAGGSISAAANPCELGVFYSSSQSVADATGSISWDETTPRPTQLAFELTLEPSGVAEPFPLATPEALEVVACEE